MEGKGEDRKGRESEGNQQPPPTPPKGGIPYQEILDDLNGRIGKRFRSIPSTQKLISARWKEGFRLEDFKKVHANMVEEWGLDEKMKPYLRPITLYSPKFDSYLNREPAPNPRAEEEEQRRIAREYREAQRDERKRRQELAAESSDKAIDTEG